jgi:orotate phosphoribosyltransferase
VVYDRQRLIELIKRDAVQFGDFTLASGKKSSFYIDCRRVTLSSFGAALVGAGMLDLLREVPFDSVGGLTLGADPIVASILAIAGQAGRELRGFIVRKEAKQHGAGKLIEGPIASGDRVVIVEDVTTTGGSCDLAIAAARNAGATVVHVVTVLDRLAGARERFLDAGIAFSALVTLTDLGLSPTHS